MIITERLILREFKEIDKESLYINHLAVDFKKWFPNEVLDDVDDAEKCIAFFTSRVKNHELPYVLAIENKEDGKMIGDTGINEVEGKEDEIEIGFSINPVYQGKGLATEALSAMLKYAKERFDDRPIYGRILKGNDASVKVLTKCGFEYLDTETNAEDDPYGNGMLVYRIR